MSYLPEKPERRLSSVTRAQQYRDLTYQAFLSAVDNVIASEAALEDELRCWLPGQVEFVYVYQPRLRTRL